MKKLHNANCLIIEADLQTPDSYLNEGLVHNKIKVEVA